MALTLAGTKAARAHYYRQFRAEGSTAQAAYTSANSFIAFRERLNKDVAESKKRSRAARRGWKTRRAA